MDIPYAGGDLLDITVVAVHAVPPEQSLRLAFSDVEQHERRACYTADEPRTAELCGSVE
jgi:hypothetical protein